MLELTPTRSQKSLKWDARAAAHLLSRAGFGGTPEEIHRLAALPLEKAVATVLDEASTAALPRPPNWVRDVCTNDRHRDADQPPHSQQRCRATPACTDAEVEDLRTWWLAQLLQTPVPLREVMTLFWHGHFTSAPDPVADSQALYQRNSTLRCHALGNFRDLEDLLAWAAPPEETSRFLAGKLVDFFGAVDLQGTLHKRLAKVFLDSQYAIQPVLQTLFTSPEFYAPPARGSLIKSPVRLLVGACRQLQLDVEPSTSLPQFLAAMGQQLFDPSPVQSWPMNQAWISADTAARRYHLADALLDGPVPGGFKVRSVLKRLFPRGVPTNPFALVDALVERLFVTRVSPFTREPMLTACRSGAAVDRPGRLLRLILSAPEYQLA